MRARVKKGDQAMAREQMMEQLYITEDEILTRPEKIIEKLFLVAIMQEGTAVTARVTGKFLELRNILGIKPYHAL